MEDHTEVPLTEILQPPPIPIPPCPPCPPAAAVVAAAASDCVAVPAISMPDMAVEVIAP